MLFLALAALLGFPGLALAQQPSFPRGSGFYYDIFKFIFLLLCLLYTSPSPRDRG